MSTETTALWAAVHKLNRPARVKIDRQVTDGWLVELAEQVDGACHVASYRSASVVWATVPSLWDQSTSALYGSGGEEGSGTSPLRERSIADLNLMEIRAQITEATRQENHARGEQLKLDKRGKVPEFHPDEVSRLASLVVAKSPDLIDLWTYRVAQWCRAIETYLNAAEHEVKPVYLRNSPCPTCGARQVTKMVDGDTKVFPTLKVEFNFGLVRYAFCQACGDAWLRGEPLEELAEKLGIRSLDTPNNATAC